MRRIALFSLLLSITQISNGQTNSLPTTGKVGIGTTSPATDLHLVGNMTLEGGYVGNAVIYTGTGTPGVKQIPFAAEFCRAIFRFGS